MKNEEALMSSANELNEFLTSHVWGDIRQTLNDRIELLQTVLETSTNLEELLRTQGSISEIRAILQLPQQLINEIEENNNA